MCVRRDSIIRPHPEGVTMNANGQGSADMHSDMQNNSNDKSGSDHIVSAARRRALKIGLATVPTMLTLRTKPVFGQDNICASLSLSAATSHGVAGTTGCTTY
jgi:hypothetical protein